MHLMSLDFPLKIKFASSCLLFHWGLSFIFIILHKYENAVTVTFMGANNKAFLCLQSLLLSLLRRNRICISINSNPGLLELHSSALPANC